MSNAVQEITAEILGTKRSKHRQFDRDGNWIEGRVNIDRNSSLRKLMRASRRGKMPDERQVLINIAIFRAAQRADAYVNSSPRKSSYRAKMDAAKRQKREQQRLLRLGDRTMPTSTAAAA